MKVKNVHRCKVKEKRHPKVWDAKTIHICHFLPVRSCEAQKYGLQREGHKLSPQCGLHYIASALVRSTGVALLVFLPSLDRIEIRSVQIVGAKRQFSLTLCIRDD